MKPEQLLKLFPEHLANMQEAETLLKEVDSDFFHLDPSDIMTFDSYRDAFASLYPGDVDSFKREKCEDYNCLFSDYGDFYVDWLEENFQCYWLGGNKILIVK